MPQELGTSNLSKE